MDPSWYGWFDCDYPKEARVKGSAWYYEQHTKLCDVSGLQVIIDLIDTQLSASSSAPASTAAALEPEYSGLSSSSSSSSSFVEEMSESEDAGKSVV